MQKAHREAYLSAVYIQPVIQNPSMSEVRRHCTVPHPTPSGRTG
jgi:hypothetical protein